LQFPEFTERRQASIQLGGVRALSGLFEPAGAVVLLLICSISLPGLVPIQASL